VCCDDARLAALACRDDERASEIVLWGAVALSALLTATKALASRSFLD
jgi:hypothetical protein